MLEKSLENKAVETGEAVRLTLEKDTKQVSPSNAGAEVNALF